MHGRLSRLLALAAVILLTAGRGLLGVQEEAPPPTGPLETSRISDQRYVTATLQVAVTSSEDVAGLGTGS